MPITVELYGIARLHGGVAETQVEGATLGAVLAQLVEKLPQLECAGLKGSTLGAGLLASLDGERFISDPRTPLPEGTRLLLLSADAGG